MARQCELIIGYLLPRRCEEKASAACVKCGRATCELHTRIGDQGLLCRDCFEERQPRSLEELAALPVPVHQTIYGPEDYSRFESEAEGEGFSTLS